MLPESWQFLGPWWWALHIVAVLIVFCCGYLIGRHSALPPETNEWQKHAAPPEAPRTSSTDTPHADP